MSKGLERLEVIKELLKGNDKSKEKSDYVDFILAPIETELKEYEKIIKQTKGE